MGDEIPMIDARTGQVVKTYGSWEEFNVDQAFGEQVANEQLVDVQRELLADTGQDRYWVRPYVAGGDVYMLFGVAWSEKRMWENAVRHVPPQPGQDTDVLDLEAYNIGVAQFIAETHHERVQRANGYLFGDVGSVLCVEPELGSTHVVNVWPITAEMYTAARDADWVAPVEVIQHVSRLVREAVAQRDAEQ